MFRQITTVIVALRVLLFKCSGMDVGREIRRRRKALGLTLEQLAERIKRVPNHLGLIETGKADPSVSTLRAIARGLGITLADLFGGIHLGKAALEASYLFEGAPEEAQEPLLQLLRAVASKPTVSDRFTQARPARRSTRRRRARAR
jgi:transcriptional regulator with XRE-family HTH domain